MANAKKKLGNSGYNWKYSTVGGVTRVNIESGDDIAHLNELDQKLWTVLSCPVDGLEFDPRTLALLDTDKDKKIRVNEVVAASQWLTQVLRNMDYLLLGRDSIDFSEVNATTDEGKKVIESAKLILNQLGQTKESITLADVDEYMAIFEEKCKEEYSAQNAEPFTPPYGDDSDDVESAVNALKIKVDDYFMRCKLLRFDEEAAPALDVQVEQIAAISGSNLTDSLDQISTYPLFRPVKEATLPTSADNVNPAWHSQFATLKAKAFDVDFAELDSITEEQWNSIVAKIDAYTEWKAAGESAMNEAIAARLEEHSSAIEPVERLLRYCCHFFTFLHNFVVFKDFYNRAPDTDAVFQAGKLYIDQRCCDLCIKVSDMGKSTAMAAASGMFLIYCTCTSKTKGTTMDIVAALTDGGIDNIKEGKNAVFYDRSGLDWDATITKVIDNPISVRQAFWSPYRKFGNWITDKITKNASEKESKQFDEMTAKADNASANITAKPEEGAAASPDAKKAPAFDIAKFAGIFAAIGLAIGAIGAALGMLGSFIFAKWYNILLLLALVVIVISGPSMLLAWLKLRKRNIGPVLNANGWAINSKILVNTTFGATLTSIAKYPKMVMDDPFAEKKTPWWVRALLWIVVLAAIAFGVLYFMHKLPWQKTEAEAEAAAVVEEASAEATADESDCTLVVDTLAVATEEEA